MVRGEERRGELQRVSGDKISVPLNLKSRVVYYLLTLVK